MAGKRPKTNAASTQIERIFDHPDDEDKSFANRHFEWIIDAATDPLNKAREIQGGRARLIALAEIFNDISDNMIRDEQTNYAREADGQRYFERAWKGSERFSTVLAYFKEASEQSNPYNYMYDKHQGYYDLHPASGAYEQHAALIKQSLAEFEAHVEAYGEALQYRLREITAVRDCVETVLKDHKGYALASGNVQEAIANLLDTANEEEAAFKLVADYLKARELDSPIILDHVRNACNNALSPQGFKPKAIDDYFKALSATTEINAKGGDSIGKFCATTRARLDKIVAQENTKRAID